MLLASHAQLRKVLNKVCYTASSQKFWKQQLNPIKQRAMQLKACCNIGNELLYVYSVFKNFYYELLGPCIEDWVDNILNRKQCLQTWSHFQAIANQILAEFPKELHGSNTTLLEKYPTLVFFCENLVDFNEAHLHEATLNLHTHTWVFFACLS